MAANIVKCRKGSRCVFAVHDPRGIPVLHTAAKFQARDDFDESLPALVAVTEATGITFDRPNDLVNITILPTVTETLPVLSKQREVAAILRTYDPANPDDRRDYRIPFMIQPGVIV